MGLFDEQPSQDQLSRRFQELTFDEVENRILLLLEPRLDNDGEPLPAVTFGQPYKDVDYDDDQFLFVPSTDHSSGSIGRDPYFILTYDLRTPEITGLRLRSGNNLILGQPADGYDHNWDKEFRGPEVENLYRKIVAIEKQREGGDSNDPILPPRP